MAFQGQEKEHHPVSKSHSQAAYPTPRSLLAIGLALITVAAHSRADRFGTGETALNIDFVKIGDAGNPPDTVTPNEFSAPLPSGSVGYTYRMAKYEISVEIIAKANQLSLAAGHPLDLAYTERGSQKPATGLSWFDAARFVNWLNEDQGFAPAYKFDDLGTFQLWQPGDPGYNPSNLFRNTRARYALPSADEWHKAAYYDPVNDRYWLYPYGSDEPPISVASGADPGTAVYNQDGPADVMLAGGESLYGVVGLAGNVYDIEETSLNLTNDHYDSPFLTRRGVNGGSFTFDLAISLSSAFRNSGYPEARLMTAGIRVVSVPESAGGACLLCFVGMLMLAHRQSWVGRSA